MMEQININEIEKKLSVENDPFPNSISENFLPLEIAREAENEFINFNNLQSAGGYRYGNLKFHFDDFQKMPKTIRNLISFFYSQNFIRLLEKKFSLQNIKPDWSLLGGGMHASSSGGNLKVHSDFIYIRKKSLRRVLNLLFYLNSNWKDEWRGNIELWDKNMSSKVKELSPELNNLLIFRTDKNSNHGFPDNINCPENVKRKSLALYYYVEEKDILPIRVKMRKYYTTQWKKRPGSNDPEFMDKDSLWRKIKYKYLPSFFIKKK